MKHFSSHVSVLSSGGIPHPPHAHKEEELLIMLSGEADIITVDATGRTVDTARAVSGSIVYHCAHRKHTIQVTGPVPAVYLIFKWTGNSGGNREASLKSSIFQGAGVSDKPVSLSAGRSVRTVIFESPTLYLRKLRCHISTLQPGAGYPPHIDTYDVAILTLSGTVETLGRQIGPSSVIFYAAGEPHGMKNAGPDTARYMVMEFHGSRLRRKWYSLARKRTHIIRRLFPNPYSLHLW
jgi:quercetin dioxygenase-like cupin family protein